MYNTLSNIPFARAPARDVPHPALSHRAALRYREPTLHLHSSIPTTSLTAFTSHLVTLATLSSSSQADIQRHWALSWTLTHQASNSPVTSRHTGPTRTEGNLLFLLWMRVRYSKHRRLRHLLANWQTKLADDADVFLILFMLPETNYKWINYYFNLILYSQ